MKKISLAYFGSPDFAADFLEKLITDPEVSQLVEVKLVVTQPDKPVGRKRILTPTPVKKTALKFKNLEIKNSLEIRNSKLEIPQIDLALVYAYGDLIPKEILNVPKHGFWNIHPSLLPKYRGTSPIAAPLINGDKTTGVTIIKMDEEIDHGPIIAQESLTIEDTDYRPDLEKKLTDLGFEMFKKIVKTGVETLGIIESRTPTGKKARQDSVFKLTEQNHQEATYTKKLTKQDGFIEFEKLKNLFLQPTTYNLQPIYNLFRGLSPWPGLWTILPGGKRLKITGLSLHPTTYTLQPTHVQLEGKKEVDFETFNRAYKIF